MGKQAARDEWAQMALIDRMHTLLAADAKQAGDKARAIFHIERRDLRRRQIEEAASSFCGRPVTGYTSPRLA